MGLREQYQKDGYIHLPALLTPEEVQHYRREFQRISGLSDDQLNFNRPLENGWSMNDAVTQLEECWPLIFNPKLLSAVREILGPEIRYTQHSDLHVNFGACGWHRDSANRDFKRGADWDTSRGDYSVVRIAIYLQSFAESRFSLGVIPGSHQRESRATTLELKAWRFLGRFFDQSSFVPPLLSVRPKWLKVEPGDCVVFSQRLFHSGSPIRGPKYSVYFSYGLDNEHSRNHVDYYFNTRKELNYRPAPQALQNLLRQNSLLLNS